VTIRTLALASGVTSLQDHRLLLGTFMGPGASAMERRGGIYYMPGAADLVSASALQATVSPFTAIVDGTSNSLQGAYVVGVDANVTITFDAGEAGVIRNDRVILQIRDTTFDASGSTDARVLYLKGNTSTGAATALPASSLLLWEVAVPIGASSITFSSARTDKRTWAFTPLRIPVNNSTERDALPAIPNLEVTRLDTGDIQQYWSGAWRTIAPAAAPTSAVSVARKTSGTSRTSTSVTADPHLTLPVEANSVYLFDAGLAYTPAGTSTGFQVGFGCPSGSSGHWTPVASSSNTTTPAFDISLRSLGAANWMTMGSNGTNTTMACPRGLLITAGTAGSFEVVWSPSNSTGAELRIHSFLRLEKVA